MEGAVTMAAAPNRASAVTAYGSSGRWRSQAPITSAVRGGKASAASTSWVVPRSAAPETTASNTAAAAHNDRILSHGLATPALLELDPVIAQRPWAGDVRQRLRP